MKFFHAETQSLATVSWNIPLTTRKGIMQGDTFFNESSIAIAKIVLSHLWSFIFVSGGQEFDILS